MHRYLARWAGLALPLLALCLGPAAAHAAKAPAAKAPAAKAPAAKAPPSAAAAGGGAAGGLDAKGLKKNGTLYVLADEAEVTKSVRDLTAARKKLEAGAKERRKIETKINMAKGFIGNADLERRKLNDKLSTVSDPGGQNQLIAKMNVLTSQIEEALRIKEAQEEKLKGLGDQGRSDYVGLVLELAGKVEAVEAKYAEAAADDEVKAALEAAKPRGKLGPSPAFASARQQIKKLRDDISAETIKVTIENDVPWVDVTLNGSVTRNMVLDTGASIICLPADLAKGMELIPPKDAPILRMQLADGKVVEARQMMLKSVRVGIFTVEDVECAILPDDLVAAQPLLGGSFLKNFVFKLDRDAEELHLAQIGAGKAATGAGKKSGPAKAAGKEMKDKGA